MPTLPQPLTPEEARLAPRREGWKYECINGLLHVSPAHILTTMELALAPRNDSCPLPVRRVRVEDRPALLALFIDAFEPAMEYVDYNPRQFRQAAEDYLRGFFSDERGRRMPVSCVAEDNGQLVAAALFVRLTRGPLLDALFTRPGQQRRGLASALVSHGVNELRGLGEPRLFSRVMLGNEESMAWHARFGFREVATRRVAGHRANVYRAELARVRELPDVPTDRCAELERLVAYWREEESRLEALAAQNSPDACNWLD